MEVKLTETYGSWASVKRAALATRSLKPKTKLPTEEWKDKMLMAEHSPIRLMAWSVTINKMKLFAQVHLVRHHIGYEKFCGTLRDDITGIDGATITRESETSMEIYLNAQALIQISRVRLCHKAHVETIKIWEGIIAAIGTVNPEIVKFCVPNCIYRGFCPEIKSCNFAYTPVFRGLLRRYREINKNK